MLCDVCNVVTNEDEGTRIPSDDFRKLLDQGFGIDETNVKMLTEAGLTRDKAIMMLANEYARSQSAWLLCPKCAEIAKTFSLTTNSPGRSPHTDLDPVLEITAVYMALQLQFTQGRSGVLERARSLYGLGFLLGVIDGICQHHVVIHESKDGSRIAAAVFQAVFQNSATATEQFSASVAAQGNPEHQDGMAAGGEEILRFLSGETHGILGLGAYLAIGQKRKTKATR